MYGVKSLKQIIRLLDYPLLLTAIMWIVFLIEIDYGYNFNSYGVYPRTFKGLIGVITSPFIHSGTEHLINNTLSFFVLSLTLRYFYSKSFIRVLIIGALLSGLFTWLFARPAYHIGMSGIIYLLAGFIFTQSFFSKNYQLIALSFAVIFSYGSMIWYVFPIDPSISWEGHLSGLVSGIILSFFFKADEKNPEKAAIPLNSYQEDLFLAHFDENGKFIDNKPFLDEEGNLIIFEEE